MQIDDDLRHCPELARLCRLNGWINNDSLRVEVVTESGEYTIANIEFEEIVMQAAGSVAGRVPCYGKVRVHRKYGLPDGIEILAGLPE